VEDRSPAPVVLERVIADKRPFPDEETMPVASPIRIPPGRGDLEFHYTALSFQAPEKNRFKYKLEGSDAGWVDAGAGRAAYYSQLAPRNYRFRVIAYNNDGVWNEAGATLSLVLLPHYWQTWWFKPAIGVAIVLVLALFYQLRVTRLREIERLRQQLVALRQKVSGPNQDAWERVLVARHPQRPHFTNSSGALASGASGSLGKIPVNDWLPRSSTDVNSGAPQIRQWLMA